MLSGARSPRPVQAGAEGPAAWGGAAAGARGAGGRWQEAVVQRPAREALEAAGRKPWCGGRRERRWRPPECAGARSHLSCMMPSSAARPWAAWRIQGWQEAGRREFCGLQCGGEWWMHIHPGAAGAGTRALRLAVRCRCSFGLRRGRAWWMHIHPGGLWRGRGDASPAALGVLRMGLCRGVVACFSKRGAREERRGRTGRRPQGGERTPGGEGAGPQRPRPPRGGTSAPPPSACRDRCGSRWKGPPSPSGGPPQGS